MVDAPEKIWATFEPHESGKGHPRTYATAARTKGQEYVRADLCAELEAENVRQSSDIAEFMRRLGPRWFLEQGWFPESMEASDDL